MDEVEGFAVSDFQLAAARCQEWGGIVFVRVAEEGPDLEEQLGPAGARMGIWCLAELRSAHTVSYEVKANWKLIIQNFAECLHCPVIHPQLARLSHYLSGENYPADPNAIGAAMDLEEGIETLSSDGTAGGRPPAGAAGRVPAPGRLRDPAPERALLPPPGLRRPLPDAPPRESATRHDPLRLAVQ